MLSKALGSQIFPITHVKGQNHLVVILHKLAQMELAGLFCEEMWEIQLNGFKGIVHPKMTILSSFTHTVVPNHDLLNTKKKKNQVLVAIDIHSNVLFCF